MVEGHAGPDHPGLVLHQFKPLAPARILLKASVCLCLSLKRGHLATFIAELCEGPVMLSQPSKAQVQTTAPKLKNPK